MTTKVPPEMIESYPPVDTTNIVDGAVTAAKLASTLNLSAKTITLPAANTPVFTRSFESAELAVVSGGAVSAAHSFGAAPKLFQAVLRCKTTEGGYAVNDEIILMPTAAFGANATNVYAALTGLPSIVPKAGGAAAAITAANWKIVLRGWA